MANYLDNPASLKIDLMLRGIRMEDPVVKAWACGSSGVDVLLPQDTLVNIPCMEAFTGGSPYTVKRRGEKYFVTDGKGEVEIKLVPKPAFYSRKTSTGVPYSDIATVHGSYTVITPSPRCDFFDRSVECRYCAGNFDIKGKNDRVYTVEEVVETVEAVLKERSSDIIYLSIGFSQGDDGGIEFLKPYIQAIKKSFSCLVAVEALPPKDNHWIDETYALGADSVLYNLEIFDKELFELICPGRASLVGRKRYLEALGYAAKVFPNGTVASHLIVGLEPPGSTCMGIDFFTDMGVVPILPIYRPSSGRALAYRAADDRDNTARLQAPLQGRQEKRDKPFLGARHKHGDDPCRDKRACGRGQGRFINGEFLQVKARPQGGVGAFNDKEEAQGRQQFRLRPFQTLMPEIFN